MCLNLRNLMQQQGGGLGNLPGADGPNVGAIQQFQGKLDPAVLRGGPRTTAPVGPSGKIVSRALARPQGDSDMTDMQIAQAKINHAVIQGQVAGAIPSHFRSAYDRRDLESGERYGSMGVPAGSIASDMALWTLENRGIPRELLMNLPVDVEMPARRRR